MFNKLKIARKLAREGKGHLTYVNAIQSKEYDIPDDTPEDKIDAALWDAIFTDLAIHKGECNGCSAAILNEIKGKMHK